MRTALTLFAMVLMLSILTACGQPGARVTARASVDIAVRAESEPLTVGETTLIVTLTDSNRSPVDGAKLQVHGDMDHQGMTPVDREVSASVNGEYRVPFEWTMGGGWIVTVTAQLPDGGEISETFNFFVEAVSSESIINRHNNAEATAESPVNVSDDGQVNVAYQPDNDPAKRGDATVTVSLTDEAGSPITDAAVEVIGDMAHHGMMPVSGTGEHMGSGQYVVPLRWTMTGDWLVTVKVTLADGRQFEQVFNQEVVMP